MDTQKQVLGVLELLSTGRPQRETGRRELLEGICAYLGQFITRIRAELALVENEAKFRILAETTPTAIFIHQEGIVVYANAACESISGYSRDEIMGRPVWMMFHDEDRDEFRRRAERRLRGEEFETRYEARLIRKTGDVRWVDYSAARITLDHRPAVVCSGIDITEQRALEAHLRQSQKMEAIGHLAGGVAHEFNNLLMIIRTYSELLQGSLPLNDRLRRKIEPIMIAAERGASLTGQMLAFSRKQIVSRVVLDLNVLIDQATMMLRRFIGEDIEFQVVKADSLGAVEVDRDQIFQVLMNLCVNARDAMPQGGGLTIATENVTVKQNEIGGQLDLDPGNYVRLSVTDTGIGISSEIQQQIFEPFFTTKEVGKGTGLGLATVYGIVKQSGGQVTVTSELGQGARFDVYLPQVEWAVASGTSVKAKAPRGGTETLLVVEDEANLRNAISEFLGSLGYRVLVAGSGEAALMLATEHEQIDLLLSDIVMPKMSGRELSQVLGTMRPDMKIIFMSGYAADELLRYNIQEMHSAFLQKPVSLETLARTIRETLDGTEPLQ
jgi:PAS domain S-box-containing protein